MADPDAVLETAPELEDKPGKAVASASDAPASEPRARRERKQADFFTPDEPKGDGQKRAIPEVCLHTPFPLRVTHDVIRLRRLAHRTMRGVWLPPLQSHHFNTGDRVITDQSGVLAGSV